VQARVRIDLEMAKAECARLRRDMNELAGRVSGSADGGGGGAADPSASGGGGGGPAAGLGGTIADGDAIAAAVEAVQLQFELVHKIGVRQTGARVMDYDNVQGWRVPPPPPHPPLPPPMRQSPRCGSKRQTTSLILLHRTYFSGVRVFVNPKLTS
jgi:hypothetical protein